MGKRSQDKGGRRKSFYAAVYGSVGAMLLLAGIIGYMNLRSGPQPDLPQAAVSADDESLSSVNQSFDDSYLDAEDFTRTGPYNYYEDYDFDPIINLPDNYSHNNDDDIDLERFIVRSRTTPGPDDDPDEEDAEEPGAPDAPQPTAKTFTKFEDGSKMLVPLSGDIVMGFSMDRLIYDKTLEQYRVNRDIRISGDVGSQVRAAAGGEVRNITTTREHGICVEIDHGNGWVTTYGQLQDKLLVKAGDVVEAGQVIGGVANPSIYSIMLGSHLQFAVMQNDKYIDPNTVLLN